MLRAAALILILAASAVPAQSSAAGDEIVIAILDTGIRADHVAFAPGQVVAWYDFTDLRARSNQTTWDPLVLTPYDNVGHGTAVASMAAGASGTGLTPSFAPGAKLAIAKVGGPQGTSWSAMSAGIRWATDVAHADIISISQYQYMMRPIGVSTSSIGGFGCCFYSSFERQFIESLSYAAERDVLNVVLAGNGEGNTGIPTLSWTHVPEVTADALIVGGSDERDEPVAPLGSMDPEVNALYDVRAACPSSPTCAVSTFGTSFSTPLVAGFAARALSEARARGLDLSAADLEQLLKESAVDGPTFPPTLEGYGVIGPASIAKAQARLDGGPAPSGPAWELNRIYVESVREQGRATWWTIGSA